LPTGASLAPTETGFYVEAGNEFDFCVEQTIETNGIITANTAPGINVGVCAAEATNIFSITFVEDEPCEVAIEIACFVNEDGRTTNCRDVPVPGDEAECVKPVTYAYVITNIGLTEQTIIDLDRTRGGESLDLKALIEAPDILPGRFEIVRESDVIDFCVEQIVATSK
jgi:hypothetical protein